MSAGDSGPTRQDPSGPAVPARGTAPLDGVPPGRDEGTALAAVSPLASAFAVAAGFAANWLLGGLSGMTLASSFPAEFPLGDPPRPTDTGLVLTTAAMALNATVAGLLTGRLAPVAPIVHAGILAGLFGMFALTGMDQARGLPGWFALAFALVPPATAVLGGWLARVGSRARHEKRLAARRGAATPVATDRAAP